MSEDEIEISARAVGNFDPLEVFVALEPWAFAYGTDPD